MRGRDRGAGGLLLVPLFLWAAGGPANPGETPPALPGSTAEEAFPRAPIRLTPLQRQTIGVTFGTAERRNVEKTIRTVGRIDWDERKLAEVTLKFSGWVRDLFVDYTGKPVRAGDPLFTIYSPDLVSAEQEYLLALRTRERLRGSGVPGALESAEALVRAGRDRLLLWDLTERQIRELEASGRPSFEQAIRSPVSGVVIEKAVFRGRAVEPGAMLYRIADPSTLWMYADVYEQELPHVSVGQEARLALSYVPDRRFVARVAFVYPALDPKTRSARVRFELENPGDGILKPEMYGTVEIVVPLGERLVIPETAVLDSGDRQVAFLDAGDGRIVPRDVRVGVRLERELEVLEGLAPGDRVVTSANFLVDSESKLQAAESMMGMMGAIGMGDWKMESAKPMTMGEDAAAPSGSHAHAPSPAAAPEEKRVGDFLVAVFPAAGAATVGETPIRVRVRDDSGRPVTGAKVGFRYTMDMPGMTIEEATAREIGDGVYEGTASFTMAGPWGLVVGIETAGRPVARARFTIRVAG